MRPRRRRSHSRRQIGVIFNPGGGVLLDSGGQRGVAGDNPDQKQQAFSTVPEEQVSSTGHAQPGHHAIPNSSSQPFSSLTISSSVVSQQASYTNLSQDRSTAPLASSSFRSNASTAKPSSSSVSRSGTVTSTMDASQFSASASSAPTVATASHSVEFYIGIGFIAVVSMACIFSLAAWLLRSRRKGFACCFNSKHDEDVENQDLGLGLGLYLDTPGKGFDQKVHSTPFPETAYTNSQGKHPFLPALHAASSSPHGYPTTLMRRPVALHSSTDSSIQAPDRLLGPLRVRNYVSGDLPSSGDEAPPSPRPIREFGDLREPKPGGTQRYLGVEGQGLYMPWAPLNVKSSPVRNQQNIAQSPLRKTEAIQAGDEQNYTLPTPPFGFTRTRKDCEEASPSRWGDTLRSSICAALSGSREGDSKTDQDRSSALPGSYARSDRWRTVLSSQKAPVADLVTLEDMTPTGHQARATNYPLSGFGHGVATFDSIGLRLRMEERVDSSAASMASSAAFTVSKKHERGSKRSSGYVKPRTMSRENSVYSPHPHAGRRSAKRRPKCAKRASVVTQMSMGTTDRPEFLRQPTTDTVTSFSSEASGPSRALTTEELRAKRTMMLRARRKRGMGMSSGTAKRPSGRITHTRESPCAEPSEA
ncbi:hypothetical protein ACEPAI_2244 [Sanghuangporus weigelae]